MLVKKSIHKVKNSIHRRLENLWSLVSKGFNRDQLSRAPSFNAIPTSNNNTKTQQQEDNFNSDTSVIRRIEVEAEKKNSARRSPAKDLNVCNRNLAGNGERSVGKTTKEERVKKEKKIGEGRGCLLAEKMKELEMVNGYDKDDVVDIEEALHYYTLITCPVYQDIVDRFFMDMYTEFVLPQPSASINNSMRRLHSIRL